MCSFTRAGHALGLQHSRDPRSVMYPAFVSTNLDLSPQDVDDVQRLYGELEVETIIAIGLTDSIAILS